MMPDLRDFAPLLYIAVMIGVSVALVPVQIWLLGWLETRGGST